MKKRSGSAAISISCTHFFEAGEAIGRKMDFLVQEMNREANTIGSKAQDVEIARKVLDIKAEIGKNS